VARAAFGPEEFAEQVGVSRETLAALERYGELLAKWQRAINLVSPTTLSELWWRHMLDSAQLHALVRPSCRTLLDIGSGAGFPGLVLAILGTAGVHLVEADARKAAFLREAARVAAPTAGVSVHAARIERIPPFAADVVTARACAPLPELLGMCAPFLAPHTVCLFPKGVRVDEELTAAGKDWRMRVERVPSVTDADATILKLDQIAREPGRDRFARR
jgi:16S rRNA (guanine527-N7)-methyltransferase